MKKFISVVVAGFILFTGHIVFAGEKSVKLKVDNMYCASCPYIVKKSLEKVSGVLNVGVSYNKKASNGTATVTFDDSITKVEDLTKATKDVGFPSKVIKEDG